MRKKLIRKIFSRIPISPANFMVIYWVCLFVFYFIAPVYQAPSVSFNGIIFSLLHILMFFLGAALLSRVSLSKKDIKKKEFLFIVDEMQNNKLTIIFLILGVLGSLLSSYGKLSDLGSFSLSSIAELRSMRAEMLSVSEGVSSNKFSIIAFFIYPAGFVGLVFGLINYEKLSFSARIMMFVYAGSIFLLAILAGGRSPILVLLIFILIGCYVRKKFSLSYVPDSLFLRSGVLILIISFFIYSSIVWSVRSEGVGMTLEAFLEHADERWGVRPSENLINTTEALQKPELQQAVLGTAFYATQNFSIVERIVNTQKDLPILFGGYHIDLVAAVMRKTPASSTFLKNGYDVLLEENIYGFFTGAWGALYIDFGCFSFILAVVWGYFSGRAWRNLKSSPCLYYKIKYIFWIYTIFISFISPPFGFSNSLMIFFWFFLFGFLYTFFVKFRLTVKFKVFNQVAS